MSDVRRLFRSLFFVWSRLSHLQKNIAQLITWSFLMIQSVSFTSAAFGGFCQGISMFFSICVNRKNAEVIKFFGILKKYVSENKIYFCSRKESNVLNKKIIFVLNTILKLDFIMQIIYCIIHRGLCSHFILFLYSSISLQEMEHRNSVSLSLFIQLAKVQQPQNEWKKKPGSSEYGPWICNWAN